MLRSNAAISPSIAKSWGPHLWGSDLVIGRHTVFPPLEWDVGESLFPHVLIDRFGDLGLPCEYYLPMRCIWKSKSRTFNGVRLPAPFV